MINFVICEDDDTTRKYVVAMVKYCTARFLDLQYSIAEFDNYDATAECIRKADEKIPTVYIFDIEIRGNGNGIQLGKLVREKDYTSEIIYLTSHLELSFSVFQYKLRVLDFISKDTEFKKVLFDSINTAIKILSTQEDAEYISIKSNNNLYRISLNDILYFEAQNSNKKIVVHTVNQSIVCYDTLKHFMEHLDHRFYQCHRSYIINKDKVASINLDYKDLHIKLVSGDICKLSKSRIKEVKNFATL